MTTAEKLKEDLKQAMIAHDAFKLSVIRLLLGAIRNTEIENKGELDENQLILVIKKQAKQRHDSIEQYRAANRLDLVEKEEAELEVIKGYLPPEMSKEELEKLIDRIILEQKATSCDQLGLVMKAVMAETKGQVDGSRVSELVKRKLS